MIKDDAVVPYFLFTCKVRVVQYACGRKRNLLTLPWAMCREKTLVVLRGEDYTSKLDLNLFWSPKIIGQNLPLTSNNQGNSIPAILF